MTYEEQIKALLSDPDSLKKKKPFTRGVTYSIDTVTGREIPANTMPDASLPSYREIEVSQDTFLRELDVYSHDVLFDDNIPSIVAKTNNGRYKEIEFVKSALPFQKIIRDKQVMHLTRNKMTFTMIDIDPTDEQYKYFQIFKQYWDKRNQDGMKTKMVSAQLSYGDAGLLYYFDRKNRIKSRLLTYKDGFVLCPHNDQNGDRILESVYYKSGDVEYIDSYDDKYMYRHVRTIDSMVDKGNGWTLVQTVEHGFDEIPLITKRGDVAWNDVQNLISSYEILYNVFNVIQRRHGWGLLYIKGKFKDTAQKLAGSVVLNDTSIDGKGDAKFLTPPNPTGTIDTLKLMFNAIQLGSSTTFMLPEDVKMSGDISGIAIQLAQGLDLSLASQKVIEWQNVADKMARLFKYGLSKELQSSGKDPLAFTNFAKVDVNAKFKAWKPLNDAEYNQMLTTLTGAGILSKETGIQRNTESAPDEIARVTKERKDPLLNPQNTNSNSQTTVKQVMETGNTAVMGSN